MNGAVLMVLSIIWFTAAYFLYGRFLTKVFKIDPGKETPANTKKDGIDYIPTKWPVLFGHHFASIAGAGPIVGPVLAAYFGWGSVALWILIGCVFIGAVHDFGALFASVREGGLSIGCVIERQIGYNGRQIFLLFSWATLVLVVAIFAMLIAKTFTASPAVATSSLLFIAISPIYGYLVYKKNMPILIGSFIFVPLLFLFVWVGLLLPLDVNKFFLRDYEGPEATITLGEKECETIVQTIGLMSADLIVDEAKVKEKLPTAKEHSLRLLTTGRGNAHEISRQKLQALVNLSTSTYILSLQEAAKQDPVLIEAKAKQVFDKLLTERVAPKTRRVWLIMLFLYVFVASTIPIWLLLQPRDYLNSYLLYAMMLIGIAGIFFCAPELKMPAFTGWEAEAPGGKSFPLFPVLFVLVACGACSGFHSQVSSGTTSKQVESEKHILPVGYGAMLVEGVLAIMALISVAYLAKDKCFAVMGNPVGAFSTGLATFSAEIGLPLTTGKTFISLVISAFMLTTLDTATRLTRFTWQELFLPSLENEGTTTKPAGFVGMVSNPISATIVAVVAAGILAFSGQASHIWPVFGASNQLLAALTLLAITLYLIKRKANFLITLIPMVLMLLISGTALTMFFIGRVKAETIDWPLAIVTGFLIIMAVTLIIQATISLKKVTQEDSDPLPPGGSQD